MCVLTREFVIPIEDLTRLSVECMACHTVMTLDLRTEFMPTVTFCPTCRSDFPPAVKDRVRALINLLDALRSSKECGFSDRVRALINLLDALRSSKECGFSFRVAAPPEE